MVSCACAKSVADVKPMVAELVSLRPSGCYIWIILYVPGREKNISATLHGNPFANEEFDRETTLSRMLSRY